MAHSLGQRRGQTIVEALVAISVLMMGLLGLVSLLSRSFALNRSISDNYTATYLAAEGVEVVKNILDANAIKGSGTAWNDGISDGSYLVQYDTISLGSKVNPNPQNPQNLSPIYFNPTAHSYSNTPVGQATSFKRVITITSFGEPTDEIRVNSTVYWTTQGGGSSQVNMEDHFLDWRL